jgi:hypothetical protein
MDSAKNKSIYFNIFFILYMYKYRGIDFNILQYSSLGFRKSTMEQWAKTPSAYFQYCFCFRSSEIGLFVHLRFVYALTFFKKKKNPLLKAFGTMHLFIEFDPSM